MKNWIVNTYKLSRLFIIEQIREPLALFWSLIAPPLLFVFLNLDSLSTNTASPEWYEAQASWYLSYLALSVTLFGFSMYLVGRRESGFMKSFIQGKKAKMLFLSSQINASLVLSFSYFVIFIFLTTTAFGVNSIGALTSLAFPFMIIMITFIWSAQFISVLPITFTNANSGISIVFMTMLIFSIAGLKANIPTLSYLNLFNPLSIATKFMSGNGVHAVESIGTISLLIALGGIGAVRMRTNPIWSRQ
ncbi:hypothetical protein ALP26_102845 [Pseudomonas savastanoi pv. glycinea]|uniref:Uncharacterized protein n=4 Tax=Pseudomonas syringae group genomosp. 2 TaxID=251698 RepID=A0A3M5JVA6_PSEA0|nr:hypothetical protein ALO90_200086 [Pseudomonas amygdali pv. aesculi]KPX24062.1 hypothetical protein ALO71_200085 [Pseudomonas amygdali pv. dendropanacis]KPX29894.1 Uncharacterized protein ALO70_02503 [Pseudomonas amygdali pv. eriobotryae]KPX49075.1 hypothetical protein ALO37_200233 [Pseudomonas savastanoi pv. glycinea]KPY47670.1 hypothetical protein ALO48_200182 [Pseudomonas syringae pv. rhaphiolepidis]KUG43846.1 hypothetical protein ALP79_200083 [Pseudomonas savastanoi pv. fraxini]RMO1339